MKDFNTDINKDLWEFVQNYYKAINAKVYVWWEKTYYDFQGKECKISKGVIMGIKFDDFCEMCGISFMQMWIVKSVRLDDKILTINVELNKEGL